VAVEPHLVRLNRIREGMEPHPPLRIGLSARLLHDPPREFAFRGKTLQWLDQSLAHWLMRRGALVFMIPTVETGSTVQRASVTMRDYIRELDGLVLQGGADVSPESYGHQPLRPEWSGDRVRDLYEIEMLWECVFQEKPVLGICRGAQLINVAFGGTLYQDVGTQVPGGVTHRDEDAYDRHSHELLIEPGSALAKLYGGGGRCLVNSLHHQSVDRLGSGLVVEARASDSVIEAIRWTGSSYVRGVQWHPELHPSGESELLDGAPLLDEFLAEAAGRRQRGAAAART
jgi:putative glutamine amidotransferase